MSFRTLLPQKADLPGLLLCGLLALAAMLAAPYLPLNALMLAMLAGILLGNLRPPAARFQPGVVFGMKKVLRLAIVLLGLRISLSEVQQLGWQSLLVIVLAVSLTFGATLWLGKLLRLNAKLTILLASGISICGASAILAADAIVEAEESDAIYAVGTISLLGTAAMLLYPLLQWLLQLSAAAYGLWVGSSVHEVAQVVAAGFAHGEQTGQLATLVKMTRVIALVPVMFLLLLWQRRQQQHQQNAYSQVPVPWFVFAFLTLIGLNSTGWLPSWLLDPLRLCGQFTLVLAMAALGLETRLDKLRAAGLKPLYLGLLSSLFICLLSLGLIYSLPL